MITSLQIGCGPASGRYRGREWVNVDLVRHDERNNFVQADGCALPFPTGRFHEIHAIHVLEHIPRREKAPGTNYYVGHVEFLREMGRVLSPKGSAYVEVPDFIEAMRHLVHYAELREQLASPELEEAVRLRTVGVFGKGRHEGDHHHWAFAPWYFEGLLAHVGLRCARLSEMISGHYNQEPVMLYRCWRG